MHDLCFPLARREAPAEGRSPEGEGANIDRRLVPYHAKCMQIQSRIERKRIQRDEKKVEYSKAWVNETWAYKKESDESKSI